MGNRYKMEELENDNEMSFLGHLEELRWRLVKSAIAIVIVAIGLFIYTGPIVKVVYLRMADSSFPTYRFFCWLSNVVGMGDALCGVDIPIEWQAFEMMSQFSTNMYFAIVGGIIVTFPFLFYQLWQFMKPALKDSELNMSKGIVFWSSLLFFLGVLFGYYVVSPLTVQFFGTFQITEEIKNNITISSYLSLITTTTLFSGLFFELPIFIYLFTKMGVIGSEMLKKFRKHALIVILILSAIITPPDIISQVIVTFPILIMYEVGIYVAKRVEKKRKEDN